MNDNDGSQSRIDKHILWCRGERDRLIHELGQYQNGTLSVSTRTTDEAVTQGTVNHIGYLELTIEQLNCVIETRSPPTDRELPSAKASLRYKSTLLWCSRCGARGAVTLERPQSTSDNWRFYRTAGPFHIEDGRPVDDLRYIVCNQCREVYGPIPSGARP